MPAFFCDYFAAPTDDIAASVIDRPSGPLVAWEGTTGSRAEPEVFPGVSGDGIDPPVLLSRLEALLTGRSVEDIIADFPLEPLAIRDGGMRLVSRLSPTTVDALAGSSEEALTACALPWSRAEEFGGYTDPAYLANFAVQMADLARQVRGNGSTLYCWLCVS